MNDTSQTVSAPGRVVAVAAGPAGRPVAYGPDRPRSTQWAAWGFLAPVTVYLVVCYAYPLYQNLDLSLHDYTVASFVRGGAPFDGLANYVAVLHDPTFVPALLHTVIFTAASLALQFAIGLATGGVLPPALPPVGHAAGAVPHPLAAAADRVRIHLVLAAQQRVRRGQLRPAPAGRRPGGLADLATVVARVRDDREHLDRRSRSTSSCCTAACRTSPTTLYEAAALDGAGPWQRFWHLTFPLLRPVSAITLLLGLIYTLKVFDIIWIMTRGGPVDSSTTFATWSYRLGFGSLLPEFGPGAAVGNLLVVIALAFGLLYIRGQRKAQVS